MTTANQEQWSKVKVGDVTGTSRSRVDPQEFPDLPYIGLKHIEKESMNLIGTAKGSDYKSRCLKFESGDILYGRLRPYLNKVYIPDFEGLCSAEFITLTTSEQLLPEFLQYVLNANDFVSFADQKSTGDRPRVKYSQISEYEFFLPPIDSQKEIIEKVEKYTSQIDNGISSLEDVEALLSRYETSLFTSASTGNLINIEDSLTSKNITIPKEDIQKEVNITLPEIPKNWAWTRLGEITDVGGGLTKNREERANNPIQVPYLRVANVYENSLDLSEIKELNVTESELEKTRLKKGDLLVVEGNGSEDQIGRVAMWDGSIDPCVHQNHLIRVRPPNINHARFILYWMLSAPGRRLLMEYSSSTSGLHTLSINKVRNIPLPYPSEEVIEKISNRMEPMISNYEDIDLVLEQEHTRAGNLRQRVVRAALDGELTSLTTPRITSKETEASTTASEHEQIKLTDVRE
jgi:type I restriction enzyme S subunit